MSLERALRSPEYPFYFDTGVRCGSLADLDVLYKSVSSRRLRGYLPPPTYAFIRYEA